MTVGVAGQGYWIDGVSTRNFYVFGICDAGIDLEVVSFAYPLALVSKNAELPQHLVQVEGLPVPP